MQWLVSPPCKQVRFPITAALLLKYPVFTCMIPVTFNKYSRHFAIVSVSMKEGILGWVEFHHFPFAWFITRHWKRNTAFYLVIVPVSWLSTSKLFMPLYLPLTFCTLVTNLWQNCLTWKLCFEVFVFCVCVCVCVCGEWPVFSCCGVRK